MAKKNKVTTHLSCGACKRRNYTQVVTKTRKVGSLVLRKFCSHCRMHIEHKETK